MSKLTISSTLIAGCFLIRSNSIADHRGEFFRAYCEEELKSVLADRRIMQINVSRTNVPGTIRGLHFQRAPAAETKLVRCLRGKVFDVAVDLRPESKTYLQYHAEILEPAKKNMLVIPEGCAHGFQVLEGESELLYLHTAPYSPEFEGGVRYDDPSLNILWPMPAIGVSERDSDLPLWNTGQKEFLQ